MSVETRERALGYYGWRIVLVAFVCHFVAVGFFFYSYGVFFKAVALELGGSRLQVSLGLTVANAVSALCAPLVGRATERGVRRVIVVGALLVSTGFALMTQVSTLWQFYAVLATLVGAGTVAMGGISPATLVTSWFYTHRGIALGIATIGVSLSGLLMPNLATALIDALGWRGSFGVYALATLVLVVPMALWLVVDRPGDIGIAGTNAEPEPLHATRDLLRTRAFWAIAMSFALSLFGVSAVLTHLIPYLTDSGIGAYQAASMLSAAAGAGVAGKFAFGAIADRTDGRNAVWLSLAFQLAGVLALRSPAPLWLWTGAITFGFGMGGVVPLQSVLIAASFGSRSYARAAGLMRPVMLPIAAGGVPLAGWVFDETGHYDNAFACFIAAFVLSAAVLAIAPEPRRARLQVEPAA
jgi:MFS family permease